MIPEGRECVTCGGPAHCLGWLGNTKHYKCRDCGQGFIIESEEPNMSDTYCSEAINCKLDNAEYGDETPAEKMLSECRSVLSNAIHDLGLTEVNALTDPCEFETAAEELEAAAKALRDAVINLNGVQDEIDHKALVRDTDRMIHGGR